MARKIFGIGMPKTATTSLGHALTMLGFNHKSFDKELNEQYNQGNYDPIFREVESYDSFEDAPWFYDKIFKELDRRFPGSKFILTVRDLQSWVESHERHYAAKRLEEKPHQIWMRKLYDESEKAKKIASHKKRTEKIIEYFKDRPEDLLVIDICRGEGWEKLCPFLGLPTPNEPIPRANRAPNRYMVTLDIWKRSTKKIVKKLLGKVN